MDAFQRLQHFATDMFFAASLKSLACLRVQNLQNQRFSTYGRGGVATVASMVSCYNILAS